MMPDYKKMQEEYASKKLPMKDLAFRGKSHRCETVSGSGRNRVTRYANFIECNAGSIESPVWYQLIWDLAISSGEEELLRNLIEYESSLPFLRTQADREHYGLEQYSVRIYDNPNWVGFISFNRKYRPDALIDVSVAQVVTECCHQPALTTVARIHSDKQRSDNTTCCPICGRWANYEIMQEFRYRPELDSTAEQGRIQ